MIEMFSSLYDPLLTLAFPHGCAVCGDSVERSADLPACGKCWDKTRIFTGDESLCAKCGAFLSPSGGSRENQCGSCSTHEYERAAAAGVYEGALAAAVVRLKTHRHVSRRVRDVLIQAFRSANFIQPDIIVPVPLSRKRSAERGYNQAEVLAGLVGRHARIRVSPSLLTRVSHTQVHRVGMDNKAREATVAKAFDASAGTTSLAGRNVLLVDDVMTSGATASACAAALKKAGAESVSVLTLARAVMLR
jgi:ComF family protein